MRLSRNYGGIKTVSVAKPELKLTSSYYDIYHVAPNVLLCCRDNPRCTEHYLEIQDAMRASCEIKVLAIPQGDNYYVIGIRE